MIDPLKEDVIPFSEAAVTFSDYRGGKPPHLSCMYRYTSVGLCGIKLEFLCCGGKRVTSREAIARFMLRLTAASVGSGTPVRTSSEREKAILRAERELGDAGL